MTESSVIPENPAESLGTYSGMFAQYLDSQTWAKGAEHMLFVFHVRKVCQQLDAGGLEKAAMSGAYLNAIKGLEARRPGAKPTPDAAGDGGTGEQSTIFDHMD